MQPNIDVPKADLVYLDRMARDIESDIEAGRYKNAKNAANQVAARLYNLVCGIPAAERRVIEGQLGRGDGGE